MPAPIVKPPVMSVDCVGGGTHTRGGGGNEERLDGDDALASLWLREVAREGSVGDGGTCGGRALC